MSIAQTRLAVGCPARGIPVKVLEDPSAVSMRLYARHITPRGHNSNSHSGGSPRNGGDEKSASLLPMIASARGRRGANDTVNGMAFSTSAAPHAASTTTLQHARAEATAAETARSVSALLHRMDGAPPGTRDHMQRETNTLHFLRESTTAQRELKKIVAGETSPEIAAAQSPQHLRASRPSSLPKRRASTKAHHHHHDGDEAGTNAVASSSSTSSPHAKRGSQFQNHGDDDHGFTEDFQECVDLTPDLCFEELAKIIPERKPGQKAADALRVHHQQQHQREQHDEGRRAASSVRFLSTSGNTAAANDDDLDEHANSQQQQQQQEPRKVLVRLPKVGLQLFSTSLKR